MQSFAKSAAQGRPANVQGGWRNQELAECCRFAFRLSRAGVAVDTESGVSDAGDPWCVFERDGEPPEVILHVARTGGRYVASSSLFGRLEGGSLRLIMDEMLGWMSGSVRWAL